MKKMGVKKKHRQTSSLCYRQLRHETSTTQENLKCTESKYLASAVVLECVNVLFSFFGIQINN